MSYLSVQYIVLVLYVKVTVSNIAALGTDVGFIDMIVHCNKKKEIRLQSSWVQLVYFK